MGADSHDEIVIQGIRPLIWRPRLDTSIYGHPMKMMTLSSHLPDKIQIWEVVECQVSSTRVQVWRQPSLISGTMSDPLISSLTSHINHIPQRDCREWTFMTSIAPTEQVNDQRGS